MALTYTPEVTCAINVKSLDDAIAWYSRVLGFSLLYRADEIGWCEFTTGVPGANVGLSQVEDVPQGGGATLTWGVADIYEAKAHLAEHGVRTDGDVQVIEGLVKLLTFYDPDGNAMMFAQSLMEQQG
jgi:catechol 2,3-dioxygenase-like lactoylglutathione lyase family enzyme